MRIIDKSKCTIIIPSNKEFLSDKKISDRLYAWVLLNGVYRNNGTYIDKKSSKKEIYTSLGIDPKTYNSRLKYLVDKGYIKENGNEYYIRQAKGNYRRYVSRETLADLLDIKQEGCIKVYLYLCSLSAVYGDKAFFKYKTILNEIGDYNKKLGGNQLTKVKGMLDKLVEKGILEYSRKFCDLSYGIEYKIDWIKE